MKVTPALIAFTYIFLLVSCGKKSTKTEFVPCINTTIDSIRVQYYNFCCMDFPVAVKCDDLKNKKRPTFERTENKNDLSWPVDYKGIIDTLLVDCEVLCEIENELGNLKESQSPGSLDTRATAIIYFRNNTRCQLCFSGDYAGSIFYNDAPQAENLRLVYLIKMSSGYYSWFSQNELENMKELSDTTFVRQPVTITYENNPWVR